VNYWGLSDQGRIRESNQDSFIVVKNIHGDFLAVVCDGIGGAKNGDWASALVAQRLSESFQDCNIFPNHQSAKKWLKAQVDIVNTEIFQSSLLEAECQGMGTTIVAALIYKNGVTIANCGDSRCYELSDEGFRQVSIDHTVVSTLVAKGALTKEQARKYPGRNILSKAVGVEKNAKLDFFPLGIKSQAILLCSDGLHTMVNDDTINRVLKKKINGEKKVKELMEIANNKGGYDNITVILLER